MFLNCKGK